MGRPKKASEPAVPPKKRRQPVVIVDTVPVETVPVARETRDRERLRLSAGFYYALSRVTLEELSKIEPFTRVSLGVLQNWCKLDGWGPRRRESEDRARRIVEEEMGAALLKMYREELSVLNRLFNDAISKMERAMPHSYEGMLSAILKLVGVMDQWRSKIETRRPPQQVAATPMEGIVPAALAPTKTNQLTPDEARLLGRELMRARRESARGQAVEDAKPLPVDTAEKGKTG